jgi:predicted GNAT family N-acyltransferase
MEQALRIRRAVFIEEQGVPEEIEIDEYDAEPALGRQVWQALVSVGEAAVATGRLLLEEDEDSAGSSRKPEHNAHIGRVAVLAEYRGRGLGTILMEALQERARDLGYPGITLAAQLHAIGFYERLGYVARGEIFLDAGIEHRWMDLTFES